MSFRDFKLKDRNVPVNMAGVAFNEDLDLFWPINDFKPGSSLHAIRKTITDMDLTVAQCKEKRVCVQAGGHVGMWPRRLARYFRQVYSFEPQETMFTAMQLNNLPQNVMFWNGALGSRPGIKMLSIRNTMGSSRIAEDGTYPVEVVTIDSMELKHLDALFIDTEGHEVHVLDGGEETIMRCRPVIHTELLPHARPYIEDWLKEHRYQRIKKIHHDEIWTPL